VAGGSDREKGVNDRTIAGRETESDGMTTPGQDEKVKEQDGAT